MAPAAAADFDICLEGPGRAIAARAGAAPGRAGPRDIWESPLQQRVPRRLRLTKGLEGGRFHSRSDIDLVGSDSRLAQTWLAATSATRFSNSAIDLASESGRAVGAEQQFDPRSALVSMQTRPRIARPQPNAAPPPQPVRKTRRRKRDKSRAAAVSRVGARSQEGTGTEAILVSKSERAERREQREARRAQRSVTAISPGKVARQRKPAKARAPQPEQRLVMKGRVPWANMIGVEGEERPAQPASSPSRDSGPTLTSSPKKSKKSPRRKSAGSPSERAGRRSPARRTPTVRPATAPIRKPMPTQPAATPAQSPSHGEQVSPEGGSSWEQLGAWEQRPTPADALKPADSGASESAATRPATAGARAKGSRSPSPKQRRKMQRPATAGPVSYSRALVRPFPSISLASDPNHI